MDNGNNHWQRFGVSEEVLNEPDWTRSLPNRIGLRDREGRFTGLTHPGDDWRFELEREASQKIQELAEKVEKGELVTVRDVMAKQEVRTKLQSRGRLFTGADSVLCIRIGCPFETARSASRALAICFAYH